MYEIWLTLNILYELGLQYLPVVIGTALLWLVLMAVAAARGRAGWGVQLLFWGFALVLVEGLFNFRDHRKPAFGTTD